MEVQPTDFENAAFAVFIVLLSRAILHYSLNFYVPISKVSYQTVVSIQRMRSSSDQVDQNMARAQKRDAVGSQKFYFRKDVFPAGTSPLSTPLSSPHSSGSTSPIEPNGTNGTFRKPRKLQNCFAEAPKPENGQAFGAIDDEYDEFTMREIFNGKVSSCSHCELLSSLIVVLRAILSPDC